MKNLIFILLILWLIVYLMFSFVIWEFNPELWKEHNRALYITVIIIISPMSFAFEHLTYKKK